MSHIRHIQRNMARTALAAEGVTKVNRRLSADRYIKGWTKTCARLQTTAFRCSATRCRTAPPAARG